MQIPLEPVPCPLCGSEKNRFLFNARDRLYGLPGTFPVVRCRDCSLIFLNPAPPLENLDQLYPAHYFSRRAIGTPGRKKFKHRIRDQVLRCYHGYPSERTFSSMDRLFHLPLYLLFLLDRRNALVMPFQGQGRFLDVGCGSGKTLAHLAGMGWQCSGVEIDGQAAERLGEALGLPIHCGPLESHPAEAAAFDVVHMSHVLEHLANPRKTLHKVHELLTSGGRLYLRLPRGDGFAARRFKTAWFGLDAPRHLVTYTPDTLRLLLEKTGFVVESIKDDPGSASLKNTLRRSGKGPLSPWFWVARIKPLMSLVEWLVWLAKQGDSMIAAARKP